MKSGISTACLYPMPLEDAFSTLLKMGFREFEIFFNTFSELEKSYIDELKMRADDAGGRIRSIHPFTSGYESYLLFSDYERRFLDGLEFYKRYFEACSRLGAKLLVLHGERSDKRARIPETMYFERYARLFELGKSFGVTVAQENVDRFLSDDPGFLSRMKKACGTGCAFVLDIKQAVRGGEDPFRICRAMGDRIVHVHINDNSPASDCLLPGFGRMDFPALTRMLRSFGFDGDLMIEVYRDSFGKLGELLEAKRTVDRLIL